MTMMMMMMMMIMMFACSPDATSNSHNGLRLGDAAELFGREFHIERWKGAVYINQFMFAFCLRILPAFYTARFENPA